MTNREGTYHDRYDALMARHGMTVRRICWRHSQGDETQCDELIQDCRIALWRRLPALRPNSSAWEEKAWVVWTCRSVFSHLRRKGAALTDLGQAAHLAAPDDSENREWVEELAIGLSRRERLALSLMIEGYSLKESASVLGTRSENVAKMRSRIVQKMKKRYEDIQNHKI